MANEEVTDNSPPAGVKPPVAEPSPTNTPPSQPQGAVSPPEGQATKPPAEPAEPEAEPKPVDPNDLVFQQPAKVEPETPTAEPTKPSADEPDEVVQMTRSEVESLVNNAVARSEQQTNQKLDNQSKQESQRQAAFFAQQHDVTHQEGVEMKALYEQKSQAPGGAAYFGTAQGMETMLNEVRTAKGTVQAQTNNSRQIAEGARVPTGEPAQQATAVKIEEVEISGADLDELRKLDPTMN